MLKKMCLQMKKKNKGFTLIELIVVIAILGILAAVLIPQFTGFQDKAHSTQVMVEAKQIATAADSLYVELGAAPTAAQIVAVAGPDIAAADITVGAVGSGHVGFVYVTTVTGSTKTFTATRNAANNYSIVITY
ncbi:type IV pilin PilA [Dehalobacter sp. UNSWDHB]|uniref:type IV pilin protein n=1 Tax=unclassified Dehalobacter TaxID=2635733 RepID=UPI00028A9633|nr:MULTISPECIES: prepilin-type N-terminal cleavage/methylation domain-containing protein [unclassified Dehalobacter]AFV03064.1 type IV pilin PilA [Dehalobacter sp. DCA]AFV06052.1 type IV pilin PilA [Dehalobacter sp. CF]EQB21271.1 type IV pilin PilA [Dehalobacter sp. UNSWDHB]OCZ55002.1 ABC transporter ATP-binding protein [Dehalobacter sp. TeCB1]